MCLGGGMVALEVGAAVLPEISLKKKAENESA